MFVDTCIGEFLKNNYENNTHQIHIIFILSSGFKFLIKNARKDQQCNPKENTVKNS